MLNSCQYFGFQDINFWGNVYPTFCALPYLRQTNGRVIVNASVENWLPLPRMSLYAVSVFEYITKHYVSMFNQSERLDYISLLSTLRKDENKSSSPFSFSVTYLLLDKPYLSLIL